MVIHELAALFDPSQSGLPKSALDSGTLQKALTVVFSITGSIALLIITIAGFQYILSQGSPQTVAKAKNAIIYAGIGLAISILGVSIVNFVVTRVT
jgi:hypothetical protein